MDVVGKQLGGRARVAKRASSLTDRCHRRVLALRAARPPASSAPSGAKPSGHSLRPQYSIVQYSIVQYRIV